MGQYRQYQLRACGRPNGRILPVVAPPGYILAAMTDARSRQATTVAGCGSRLRRAVHISYSSLAGFQHRSLSGSQLQDETQVLPSRSSHWNHKYGGAACCRACGRRRGRGTPPASHRQGRGAECAAAPVGLPVPPALPQSDRKMQDGRSASRRARRRSRGCLSSAFRRRSMIRGAGMRTTALKLLRPFSR